MLSISYIKVKENRISSVIEASKNRMTDEVNNIAHFESFYSMPKKNAKNYIVEVAEWKENNSIEINRKIQDVNLNSGKDINSIQTYVLKPQNDDSFDFELLLKKDQAIEFAARQIPTSKRKTFIERGAKFLSIIKAKKGYLFSQEFKALNTDADVLIFAWDSQKSFEDAGKETLRSIKTMFLLIKYFMVIKNKDFQVGTLL
jgi:hypothetical protein